MAIQVLQQPASVSLAGNPIIVKAKTTLTGKTFLRIRMSCDVKATRSGEEISYSEKYVYEVGSDGLATFNVSDTVRTALERCIVQEVSGTTLTQTMYAASYTLTYKEVYLYDNVEIEEGEVTSEEYKAILGRYTEFERLTAPNADTSVQLGSGRILSRKPAGEPLVKGIDLYVPAVSTGSDTISFSVTNAGQKSDYSQYTGGALVPASLRIDTSSLAAGKTVVSTSDEGGVERYVVESSPGMRHFLFQNTFGLIESVTAVMRESLSYDIESNTYSVPQDIDFRGTTRVVNYAGLVRGETQRIIKLEGAGLPQDGMIEDVASFIAGLRPVPARSHSSGRHGGCARPLQTVSAGGQLRRALFLHRRNIQFICPLRFRIFPSCGKSVHAAG